MATVSVRLRHSTTVLVLLTLVGLTAPAHAQQAGQISGSVRDQTGAPLPDVTVDVRGVTTRESRSDSAGVFELLNLPAGDYTLTASLTGFQTLQQTVRVEPGRVVSLPLTLVLSFLGQTIVTATKSGEVDVQSVPLAISAVSGEELARTATRTIEQAVALLPSVTFTQNSTFGQLSIRGIGTNLINAGGDPSSAMYIDGVYLARPAMVFVDLLDLARIEVLRGPQGTLYGRNAVGGTLNLISKPPTKHLEASARFTAGDFGELRAEGRVSGPLTRDRLTGSIAVVRGVRDGYVRDLEHPSRPLGGDDLTATRGQLGIIAWRDSDVLISADVSDQQGIPLTYSKVLQIKPGFAVDNPADFHEVRTSLDSSARLLHYGTSARVTVPVTSAATLVSLTAFRRLNDDFHVDGDSTELSLLDVTNRERQHQWSEELTLTHRRSRLTSNAGMFLFHESEEQTITGVLPQTNTRFVLDPRVDVDSAAVFGQTTIGLTSKVSTTAGVRYTRERKAIDNAGARYAIEPAVPLPGTAYSYSDSILHSAWTPKFGVDFKLPRRAMAYVSATRGFKSGGFNLSSTEPGRGFAPESAWSYEAGLKTEPLGGRIQLNVAAFTMDYTNLQVQAPVGFGVFDIRNAAAATIRGIEVEGEANVGRGLKIGGHLSWLDATYDEYTAVAIGGLSADVAGNRLNNAPEWSGRAWVEWNGSLLGSDLLTLTLDTTAQSTVFFTPFNDSIQRQSPYALVGARGEIGPRDRRWSANVYVRNLTGTDYIMAAFATSPAAFGGRPGAPRQFGAQFIVRR
jgi:iron complex outermembrane receptor protein